MYESFDDVIVIVHDNISDAVEVSANAEVEFVSKLKSLGFDLLYETRNKWWPINYSAVSINN